MCPTVGDDRACHQDGAPAGRGDTAPAPLHLSHEADPGLPRRWRRLLAGWVEEAGAGPEMVDRVVLAMSEAVSNCVEHGYRDGGVGEITLDATSTTSATAGWVVVVEVADHGRWLPPPDDPGYRGRGLETICASADDTRIVGTSTGTAVSMIWQQPPP